MKLSALHPRYEPDKRARLRAELLPRVARACAAMREAWLPLTIDAEEQDKLDLSLGSVEPLFADPALAGWNGLGLAVQAYGKRALPVIDWLSQMAAATDAASRCGWSRAPIGTARSSGRRKQGLPAIRSSPARSNRRRLSCLRARAAGAARRILPAIRHPQRPYARRHRRCWRADRDYEFQRLHGMGEALYREVVAAEALGQPCRIYAPVGSHKDLLAYLVRRLLENGANTSFVNRLADDEAPIADIVADPVEKAARLEPKRQSADPAPAGPVPAERRN